MVKTMNCSTVMADDVNGVKNGADSTDHTDPNANGVTSDHIKDHTTAYHNGNGWVANNFHPTPVTPVTPGVFTGNGDGKSVSGQSPVRCTRFTPSPHSRGTSPSEGGSGGGVPPPPPLPPNLGPAQHVVHLHVNPGEAISFQMGDQMQLIQGPATVRMVSNNPSPPIPMPVHVPPGHMVQQIVDENGTLRHVILSPQPPMSVPMGPTYAPGPAPTTGPASPHFYAYPPPYPHHPHPQYHHPHPAGPPPPPTHMQAQGVSQTMHGQVPPLTTHQCNSHRSHQGPSPPPPPPTHHQHKDERTQRQLMKLKRKLDARQQRESSTNVADINTTSPTSPKKENAPNRKYKDRNTSTSGLEDPEENNAQDEEESRVLIELLSKVFPPTVSEVDARSALLRWKPPDMYSPDGVENKFNDFAIQESEFTYEVLLSDRGKENKCRVVYSGGGLECKLTNLKPATDYHVCLQAVLQDLRGGVSETNVFRTECCEPDCPQPPKMINRTKTSLTLKWNAVADNGSRVTNYVLESDEGRGGDHFVEVYNGGQKQTKLIKLLASTCYRFRLTALNEFGRSKTSDLVAYVTSGSPPSQPLPPELKEAYVNRLLIGWQKRPTDDEFSLQKEEESTGEGFLAEFNGKETQYMCTNLTRNTEYKFRLCAANDEGSSRWSDILYCSTLPDRPSMPGKPYPKGRIHSTCFKITWDPPKDNGGSAIEEYIVEMDAGEGFVVIYSGLASEIMCDRLQPGSVYRLKVCALSQGGRSEYSEIGTVMTLPVCPGACPMPRVHGKPRATTLLLKWAPPEYDGGSSVTEFEVEMTSPDNFTRQVYRGRDLECLVASLLPGRPYLFQVRAYNKIGCGPWSELLEVLSGAGPPDRPTEPTVMFKSPHLAVVSWEEPVNNGAAITEFRLDWSVKDGEFTQLFQGSALSYELKNLTPATQYNFRLRAINCAGSSLPSEVSTSTSPPSSPGAISTSSVKYTCTARSIQLTWKEPPSNGSDIILYNVDLGEKHPMVAVGNTPECLINNLPPETTFRIRVQAVNGVGVGPFTSTVKVTTLSLPPLPPKLECTKIGHNSLVLKWGEGKNLDFTQYTLEMENRAGHFVPIYQGTSLAQKVSKLNETTEYRFRIGAANDAGSGPYSDVFSYVTCKAPPPALKAPRVSEVTETSCYVEWLPAKPVGDDPVIYQLQLLNAKEQEFRSVYKGSELCQRLSGLDSKTEYCVRVGPIRLCRSTNPTTTTKKEKEVKENKEIKETEEEKNDEVKEKEKEKIEEATPPLPVVELAGAMSASTTFVTPCHERLRINQSKANWATTTERKPLTDQQWAMIILFSFTLVALLIAVVVQRLITL